LCNTGKVDDAVASFRKGLSMCEEDPNCDDMVRDEILTEMQYCIAEK
jgi:hypothetical protein